MTDDLQAAKRIVLDMYAALDAAAPGDAAAALAPFVAEDWRWQGYHPFNELTGPQSVADAFWAPLKTALGPLQRRPDLFLSGPNFLTGIGGTWVAQMGHLMGLWDAPFLGLGPSRKIAFFRYVEFHRVEGNRIVHTASYMDLLHFFAQAGLWALPPQTGALILTPGPRTHDGLLYEAQDPAEGRRTIELIMEMIEDLKANKVATTRQNMETYWTPDMCWFGPAGIGASAFVEGYFRGHTKPFETGLEILPGGGHTAEIGEGLFGGFFGYPSLLMKNTGGYIGMTANDTVAEMRIVDMYRRQGDKIAENWIFIDMPHFFAMQGLDVLARMRDYPRT